MNPLSLPLNMGCKVCGEVVRFTSWAEINDPGVVVEATCHGSKERLRLSQPAIVDGTARTSVLTWLAHLFTDDLRPDVLELIQANRNPWLLTSKVGA